MDAALQQDEERVAPSIHELQASERRLRLSQKAGRIGSFEWLIQENKVIWTPELEALYALPEGSFEGSLDNWTARVVPGDAAQILAGVEDCLAKRQAEHAYEFRAMLPDGRLRWLRGQGQFYYDQTGAPERMIGVNIDIDDQKQAEAKLRQQWDAFDSVLSHTPDFAYTFDLEGRFTYANHALLSYWGKPLEAMIGKNFRELGFPLDSSVQLERHIEEVIRTKKFIRDDTPFGGAAEETRHFEYIFVPVFGPEGQIEAIAGSSRDVTERERIEKALAASEEKLQSVFAQAPVAIIVFRGRDFVVEMVNPSSQALLPGRQLVGRRLGEAVPELGQLVWDELHRVFDTGEPFVANEWRVPYDYSGDGMVLDHWFNVSWNPLRDAEGTVSGLIAVLTDVTPQVQARQQLERVNRELEEFAYVASHDLQEPLRMVNIYTQLILKQFGGGDAKLDQYAGLVRQGVTRMEALIQDLLAYSSTAHDEQLPVGMAQLSEALDESLSVLRNRIEEANAVVSAAQMPKVRGDSSQLAHVFENLISNALKYSKADTPPRIEINAELDGGMWVVSVRDNGIGFEPQYADRIFGLFKRLHKNEYPGTGLGLAICRRIVERYGGRIWAEGNPGQGAAFFFALPRVEEAQ